MTRSLTEKLLLSILSGLMLSASFPPGKMEWMAWVALIPLLRSIADESPRQAFRLGFIAGFVHYLTLIYWIVVVLEHYGGLHFLLSAGVLMLLCTYLAIYPGLFACLLRLCGGFRFAILITGSLWVGIEYVRANVLTGFPWCLLGYTQYPNLALIQVAHVVGVYGISFLLVASNVLIHVILFDRPSLRGSLLRWEMVLVLAMVFGALTYGHQRLAGVQNERNKGQQSVRIAVIQGNMDQTVKWNPDYQEKTIRIYNTLTYQTGPFKPDLVVWPETAVPFFFQAEPVLSPMVMEVAKKLGTTLIFGSPAYEREGGNTRYFNRAYALSPEREISGFYDKVHLVPFGEYVPLKRFLPFVHRLVPAAGDFKAGENMAPLRLPRLSAAILICYEVIFPELARAQTEKGADILVNLTNDAWFGMTSAPYQHLSMAVFRAVENGRPLVRAANTGFSAFISQTGAITLTGELFTREALKEEVLLGERTLGFYTKYGDLFAVAMLAICLILFSYVLCYKLKRFKKEGSTFPSRKGLRGAYHKR